MAKIPYISFGFWPNLSNNYNNFVTSLLTLLTVVFIFCWYRYISYQSSNRGKLPSPPGPRGLPLLGNILSLEPELHTYFAKLSLIYGPIYKLHLGNKAGIVISSPSLAKEVLKDYDTTFANRDMPTVAKIVTYEGKDIVWTPLGAEWRMLRMVCVREMLRSASMDAVSSLRRSEVRQMVRRVYSKIGSPTNVGGEVFLTAMDIVTSMLWGGNVNGNEGTNLGAEFREVVSEVTSLLGKPNISDFYPVLKRFDLQGLQKQAKVLNNRFNKIYDTIIAQRLKMEEGERKQCKDFLQLLLDLIDEKDPNMPFTMLHLKAVLMDMVTGGTDTTLNSIEWAIAELINKPETLKKAQRELDIVVGRDSMVEESHLPHLTYLHLVMKEALRLHPPVPLLVLHCPTTDCDVGGYRIEQGSRVFVNVWAIHRDPTIWANPYEFEPERFLYGKWDFSGSNFNYFPFGSGRRICPGMVMGEKMFMYQLATLLHSFDWRMKEGEKVDLTEKFAIVFCSRRLHLLSRCLLLGYLIRLSTSKHNVKRSCNNLNVKNKEHVFFRVPGYTHCIYKGTQLFAI